MFGEQRGAQVLEEFAGRATAAAPVVEVGGERLDPLELPLELPLVMGERHALGEHVGHQLQLLERDVGEHQGVALDRLLARGINANVEHLRLLLGALPVRSVEPRAAMSMAVPTSTALA